MCEVLLVAGAIGLLGMTWLFPLAGRLLWEKGLRVRGTRRSVAARRIPAHVAIVLPAHNEEAAIGETLACIYCAILRAHEIYPNTKFTVLVGADACTDRTVQIARLAGAAVMEFKVRSGKWRVLRALARSSRAAEWLIFVDAGVHWDDDFLSRVLPVCAAPDVMAVLPTYRYEGAGVFEGLQWRLERHLKALEARAGGPVSGHGATVLYRRPELIRAFRLLSRRDWLNDDVVVPLALRAQNPGLRIEYRADLGVYDKADRRSAGQRCEYGRRRRIVLGNIQWICVLYGLALRRNRVAGVLAARRVFRLLWAYWGLMLGAGAAVLAAAGSQLPAESIALVSAVALAALILAAYQARPVAVLLESAWASLLTPYYWYAGSREGGAAWK